MSRLTRSSCQRVSSLGRRRRLRLETLELRQLLAADLLFFDSFEVSEWNGQWVEDSQNDWFRSTQRATDGSRSAEVDGSANNATLTLANSLDLSGYSSVELTYSWYIESSWDTGEYIAIDVFNGSWQEVDRLRGNVDAENTWHHETIVLDDYLSAGFLLRFRASVSDSSEDGNVDNVRIVGTVATTQAPVAYAGADQTLSDAGGNGDEFVMLSGTGSDSDGTIVSYEWRNGTTVLGTTAHLSTTLATGTHTLTLIVTDDDGASASDTINITINEVLAKPVKVFLLAGQSNMTGTARVENLDPLWNVPQDDVWIWLDHNMDGGQWTTLAPGHGLSTHAPRPDEPEGLDSRNGLGPELSLGSILADAYPDHRVALIKHGDGGRDLASHFNPENIGPPESSEHMWSGLLKKTYDAFAVLDAAGYAYEVEGFFWAMGGGDARNKNSDSSDPNEVLAGEQEALVRSAAYGENLTNFIHAVRDEFSDDSLPFVMSQIQDDLSPELLEIYPGAELVRQGQLDVAASMPWTVAFTTEGITLRDAVHYDAAGQIEFGTRFTNNYFDLLSTSSPPEISISDATATEGSMSWTFAESFESEAQVVPYQTWDVTRSGAGDYYATTEGVGELSGIMRINGQTGAIDPEFVPLGTAGLSRAREITIQGDWIYVASRGTDEILRFDLATGDPDPAGAFVSSGDHGLVTPRGITFDHIGNLLVISKGTNEILKYDADGDFLGVFASGITSILTPNDLTLDAAGNVYVTGDAKVYRYASDGTFLGVFADGESAMTTAIEFGPDGHLYVADGPDGNVLRFDGQTGVLIDVVIGSSFGEKQGMAFDGAGSLYVANHPGNTSSARLLRYASSSAAAFTVSLSAPSEAPITLAYDTSSNSAIAGSDFVATSGTLIFEAGVTSRTIIVPTIDDTQVEETETFFVNLSNPIGGVIGDSQGVATIIDNDLPPTKFYIVNDGSPDRTYEYGESGNAVENYSLDSGNTAPRGAASNLAGDKVWVVDANKKVYVYNDAGGLLGSWTASSLASNATVEGIATNGTDVWIVDARQDRVYRYANAASRLSGSQSATSSFALNSGNRSPKDIVTDGTHLWVVEDSTTDKVFKYTLSGSLVGSWTINAGGGRPTGITLDPSGASQSLWIVDSSSDRVDEYTNSRAKSSGSQSAAVSFALAAGNTNPQGIADPPTPKLAPAASLATPISLESRPATHSRAPVQHLGWNSPATTRAAEERLEKRPDERQSPSTVRVDVVQSGAAKSRERRVTVPIPLEAPPAPIAKRGSTVNYDQALLEVLAESIF